MDIRRVRAARRRRCAGRLDEDGFASDISRVVFAAPTLGPFGLVIDAYPPPFPGLRRRRVLFEHVIAPSSWIAPGTLVDLRYAGDSAYLTEVRDGERLLYAAPEATHYVAELGYLPYDGRRSPLIVFAWGLVDIETAALFARSGPPHLDRSEHYGQAYGVIREVGPAGSGEVVYSFVPASLAGVELEACSLPATSV